MTNETFRYDHPVFVSCVTSGIITAKGEDNSGVAWFRTTDEFRRRLGLHGRLRGDGWRWSKDRMRWENAAPGYRARCFVNVSAPATVPAATPKVPAPAPTVSVAQETDPQAVLKRFVAENYSGKGRPTDFVSMVQRAINAGVTDADGLSSILMQRSSVKASRATMPKFTL